MSEVQLGSTPTASPAKKKGLPWWGWLLIVLFGIGFINSLSKDEESSTPTKVSSSTTAQESQPAASAKPVQPAKPAGVPWAKQQLTSAAARKVLPKKTYPIIDVKIPENGWIIVSVKADDFWDNSSLLNTVGDDHAAYCKKLFENPGVKEVSTVVFSTMIDKYGKETSEECVRVHWTRATHEKINYNKFASMYRGIQSFIVADIYNIHPGMFKDLDESDKEKLGYSSMKLGE